MHDASFEGYWLCNDDGWQTDGMGVWSGMIKWGLDDFNVLPREAVGDSNDRGWFLWINHGHVTYFSL